MGAVIATELRALWLAGAVEASTWSGRPHAGLDCWSPNSKCARYSNLVSLRAPLPASCCCPQSTSTATRAGGATARCGAHFAGSIMPLSERLLDIISARRASLCALCAGFHIVPPLYPPSPSRPRRRTRTVRLLAEEVGLPVAYPATLFFLCVPAVNGQFGKWYTKGLQEGEDARYMKVAVTLKYVQPTRTAIPRAR